MQPRKLLVVTSTAIALAACVPDPGTPPDPTTTTTSSTTTTLTTTTTTVPPDIAITASDPATPATSTTPRLTGFAPGATASVRIFATSDCTGPTVGFGDLATFAGPGIAVNVDIGSTSLFTAIGSGPNFVTACSAPFTYVNTLTAPTGYEHEPNGTVAEANPLTVDIGTPADLEGLLDGPPGMYASDNFTFTVDPGRSIRVETFDWTGAKCSATDTKIYLYPPVGSTGGIDDNSGIDLCSLIDPNVDTYASNVAGGEYRVLVTGIPLGGRYRLRIEVLP